MPRAARRSPFGLLVPAAVLAMAVVSPTPITAQAPTSQAVCGPDGITVTGRVIDAVTGQPVPGSQVRVGWNVADVEGNAPKIVRCERRATTDAQGAFATPAVPGEALVVITAEAPDGRLGITFRGVAADARREPVVVRVPAAVAAAEPAACGVRGHLVDAAGTPVAGAYVVVDDGQPTPTGADGGFSAVSCPANGGHRLRLAGDGLSVLDVWFPVDTARAAWHVTLDRDEEGVSLVLRTPGPLVVDPTGFLARRRQGRGTFLTAADLLARPANSVADALRFVPFVLTGGGGIQFRRDAGRTCQPQLWLDGIAMSETVPLWQIPPTSVYGVELYRGAASVPTVFGGMRGGCGAIVVWTRTAVDDRLQRQP